MGALAMLAPFLAVTDQAWFEHLSSISHDGRVDEVNFWSPRATRPMKRMRPGEPVFFKLKAPRNAIAGYGFFAHFAVLDLRQAWTMFEHKNGDPSEERFLARIGGYRGADLADVRKRNEPLGCTLLRDACFWPRERWIAWGTEEGWHKNIVQGRSEDDPARASRLLAEIQHDDLDTPPDLAERFELVDADEREVVRARTVRRLGQGTFRSRLLDAYGRCAITGERTEPVLDAAHIQPYLGARSNHLQNGLLLCKEFHALFDLGLVTVTPELRVRVSPRLRERWSNGKRYYDFDGQPLRKLPDAVREQPSREALAWHGARRFQG